MTLCEYVQVHCKDILNKYKVLQVSKQNDFFSYDEKLAPGQRSNINPNFINDTDYDMKLIFDDNNQPINIEDIIELTLNEFSKQYKFSSAIKAYEKYMNAFDILTGEAIVKDYYNQIEEEKHKYDNITKVLNAVTAADTLDLGW